VCVAGLERPVGSFSSGGALSLVCVCVCVCVYAHVAREPGLASGFPLGSGAVALMKVWLMVLTEIPYSSTSARRQSKKAWAACLEAASDDDTHTRAHKQRTKHIHTFRQKRCDLPMTSFHT